MVGVSRLARRRKHGKHPDKALSAASVRTATRPRSLLRRARPLPIGAPERCPLLGATSGDPRPSAGTRARRLSAGVARRSARDGLRQPQARPDGRGPAHGHAAGTHPTHVRRRQRPSCGSNSARGGAIPSTRRTGRAVSALMRFRASARRRCRRSPRPTCWRF